MTEIHPDARAFLDQLEEAPPMHTLTPEELRNRIQSTQQASTEPEPVGDVETIVVHDGGHGIPVRLYTPTAERRIDDGPLPVLVWLHGGGFIMGNLETEDPAGRALANASGCLVACVDYRLAPEHPFPAALKDVYAVIEWLNERAAEVGGDPNDILVGGASAGGNLAAATTHLVRDRDGPELTYQILAYPAVSYEGDFDSREQYAGYFVTEEFTAWVNEQYLADPIDGANPYAYPLQATDFTNLPPASVVTAGFDMMLDESKAYVEALRAGGSEVTVHHFEDMIHSFFTRLGDPEWERAREAVSTVGDDVRLHLTE